MKRLQLEVVYVHIGPDTGLHDSSTTLTFTEQPYPTGYGTFDYSFPLRASITSRVFVIIRCDHADLRGIVTRIVVPSFLTSSRVERLSKRGADGGQGKVLMLIKPNVVPDNNVDEDYERSFGLLTDQKWDQHRRVFEIGRPSKAIIYWVLISGNFSEKVQISGFPHICAVCYCRSHAPIIIARRVLTHSRIIIVEFLFRSWSRSTTFFSAVLGDGTV